MNPKRNVPVVIVCLLGFALASFGGISVAVAGEFTDEFDGNTLNEGIWDMKAEGGASYTIANGKLTMSSPDVADGMLMYWRADVDNTDFTVEVKAAITADTSNAAVLTFIKTDLPPTANTAINSEWLAMVWCGANTPGWYINNDDWKRAGATGPEFEGIWKAEIKGDKIHFYFNGSEVVVVDKVADQRFLCFGPDTYTSHYSGEMAIDWIKVSGPTIAAVLPTGKLPVMWGELKSQS